MGSLSDSFSSVESLESSSISDIFSSIITDSDDMSTNEKDNSVVKSESGFNIDLDHNSNKPNYPFVTSRCIIRMCSFVSVFIIIVLVFCTPIGFVFILVEMNVISLNPSSDTIILPDGMKKYNLNTLTFRNGTLYRFDSNVLLLNEDEGFEEKSYFIEDPNGELPLYEQIYVDSYDDEKVNFDCDAECNCYVNDVERRIVPGSLIYTERFYQMVVTTGIVGFAVAKFMGESEEKCYRMARSSIGDVDSLTCFMESIYDPSSTMDDEICTTDQEIRKNVRFQCSGSCRLDKKGSLKEFDEWERMDDSLCRKSSQIGHVYAPKIYLAKGQFQQHKLSSLCSEVRGLQDGYECRELSTLGCKPVAFW